MYIYIYIYTFSLHLTFSLTAVSNSPEPTNFSLIAKSKPSKQDTKYRFYLTTIPACTKNNTNSGHEKNRQVQYPYD